MTNISLLDDCIMLKYDNEVQTYCQEFSCGEADLDDFFRNDAIKYADELMGKTYCWITESQPHQIVAAVTLVNDSIKTTYLDKNTRNRLNRPISNQKRGRSYPATLIGRLGVNNKFQGCHIGHQVIEFLKDWFRDDENKTGCRFLVVDAYNNERTLHFYESNFFKYLHSSEEEERRYYNMDGPNSLDTRMMFLGLIK